MADEKIGLRFAGVFALNALGFAVSLATLLTIVLFGLGVIAHGVPMCGTLIAAGELHMFLYTSCGCAVVELILLPLSAWGVWIFAPRLFRQYARLWKVRLGKGGRPAMEKNDGESVTRRDN